MLLTSFRSKEEENSWLETMVELAILRFLKKKKKVSNIKNKHYYSYKDNFI